MKRINVNGSEVHIYGIVHSRLDIFADFQKREIEKMTEEELYDIVLIEGYGDTPFHKLIKEDLEDIFKDFHIYSLVKDRKVKKIGIIDPAIINIRELLRSSSQRSFIYTLVFSPKEKRDDFMCAAIKNVVKYYKKILVIVGKAHEESIYKRLKGEVKVNLWKYYYEYTKKLNEGEVNYGAIIYSIKENKARVIPYYPFLREFELKNGLDKEI